MPTLPAAWGVWGYGTAALTYGLHLLTRFPRAENEEQAKKIRAALVANGFAFGGIAQFVTGLLIFVLYNDIVGATTFGIFGVLWTAIWLNDYFNLDPRPLVFLDISIAIWTFFAGFWDLYLGHPVIAALMWSICALVIALCWVHGKNKGHRVAGAWAFENALLCFYIAGAIVSSYIGALHLPY